MAKHVLKGDLVEVISGADRGKQGRVIEVRRHSQKVRVEGIRMQKRHLKPGRRGARTGGIVDREGFVDVSCVMLVDPKDQKPSRIRMENRDGQRKRVFVRSGEEVPGATAV